MTGANRTLVLADRLVTCDPARARPGDELGVIERAFVTIEDGRVAAIGRQSELPEPPVSADVLRGELVSPGLVDAHTHAPWIGSRHDEYALRMQGADYETIARAGGGIVSSMRAVRAATADELELELQRRVRRMAAHGVTTLEAKSGYGLDLENERKQLRAIRTVAQALGSPRLVATYLALHALPPEAKGDRDGYAARVAASDLQQLSSEGLFDFVDAYIDRNAFSAAQARPVLERARAAGAGIRLHVGQFADVGGAELAAELGASSVDHLEVVSAPGRAALAAAGVRAVLLPVASFTLGAQPPDVAALRAAGIRLVVASDANPGTAPTESLPLALAMAVRSYGLSLAEAILGATREAAISLGLDDVGVLREGARADLAIWDLPHEAALIQPLGVPRARYVLKDGAPIFVASAG